MKPLHRPMFRYGGPIKEGVMHGMKNNGSGPIKGAAHNMREGSRTDYNFGGNVFPDMRGRVTGPGGYAGTMPFGGALQQPPANPSFNTSSNVVTQQIPKGSIKNYYDKSKNFMQSKNFSEKGLVNAFKKYGPKAFGTIKNVGKGILTKFPAISSALGMEYVTRPSEYEKVLNEKEGYGNIESRARKVLDFTYDRKLRNLMETSPELFNKARGIKDKEKIIDSTLNKDNVPDAVGVLPKTKAQREAEAEDKQEQRLNKIYKTLGVDRAKRNAASNALIDMSQYIEKNPITKKTVSSTINAGLQAFSKRLDKVDQLKEAAGLLLAKGEIAEMGDPLGKEAKRIQIALGKKQLYPSARDIKTSLIKKDQTLNHGEVITIAKNIYPNAIILADAKVAKDAGVGKTKTAIEYVEDQIELQGGNGTGVYIVDKAIIEVDAKGKITQHLE